MPATELPDGSYFSIQKQPEDGERSWFGQLRIGWQSQPVFEQHGRTPDKLLAQLESRWRETQEQGQK